MKSSYGRRDRAFVPFEPLRLSASEISTTTFFIDANLNKPNNLLSLSGLDAETGGSPIHLPGPPVKSCPPTLLPNADSNRRFSPSVRPPVLSWRGSTEKENFVRIHGPDKESISWLHLGAAGSKHASWLRPRTLTVRARISDGANDDSESSLVSLHTPWLLN